MINLFHAPTATGKTQYAINLARTSAETHPVIVCVQSKTQVHMWQQRLATAGGALGVRVLTFDELAATCLNAAHASYTHLAEPVQYRLIRQLTDEHELTHFAPLKGMAGFVSLLQKLFRELKQALIDPLKLSTVIADMDDTRLAELTFLYYWYQAKLQDKHWADSIGLHWLAVEQLENHPTIGTQWPLLIVDGYDNFTPTQLALFKLLSQRVTRFTMLLTDSDTVTFDHFKRTRTAVQNALTTSAEPLPTTHKSSSPLSQLTHSLFTQTKTQIPTADSLTLLELPTQSDEIRAALRWLKQQIIQNDYPVNQTALLARDITPYRPFVQQIAAEFGLPVRIIGKVPLRQNPAVAALLNLLSLRLLREGKPALPRRQLLEAWRSPYFDWPSAEINITPATTAQLERAALAGRVIGGQAQWQETFDTLTKADPDTQPSEREDRRLIPPKGPKAAELATIFEAFTTRIQPPTSGNMRDFVAWLEALIGPDPAKPEPTTAEDTPKPPADSQPKSLSLMACVRASAETTPIPNHLIEGDIAALRQFKNVLRGLVWAEEALELDEKQEFAQFFTELRGAVDAASFIPPAGKGHHILVADVNEVRGLTFDAVALVGMAEGLFPQPVREDPFLRDQDRDYLREHGLQLEPSTLSSEREFFYEAIGRPRQTLLLTRPRLADNGAEWQPSPFWNEVKSRTSAEAQPPPSLTPTTAASENELLSIAATQPALARTLFPDSPNWQQVERAGKMLRFPITGDLHRHAATFAEQFGPDHVWSASRLETYRSCAYRFFVGSVLKLSPRPLPEVGPAIGDLGSIYHDIFEQVYKSGELAPEMDEAAVSAVVIPIARPLFDQAPDRYGFRTTAWWSQTQAEILTHVIASILALAELAEGFTPQHFEEWVEGTFGEGDTAFKLHGLVDRIDIDDLGRARIIDYKLGGKSNFTEKKLTTGEKLQLPLYAIAAQQTLKLDQIADGFYWHFTKAEKSGLTLNDYGVVDAVATAEAYARDTIQGVQHGHFQPQPPSDGCPSYCPATAFCWLYKEQSNW